ncbi:hypothetical protein [Streptomyces sp. NBC_01304]|uniref:hypothetical protein n=1 Tax=Streptomyces sp. NBC_01304 TaxID=2903818 RepID=UPI002E12FFF4|nr:hypothetical protein OG430_41460 [Streptomyces sp. NBC_01304]
MSDGRTPLTITLERLDGLLGELGLARDEVLDLDELAYRTGVHPPDLTALLERREVADEDVGERARKRFKFLYETRRTDSGELYAQDFIAREIGVSRGWISALLHQGKEPNIRHAERLERFFDVPSGFLVAPARQALDRELRPILENLISRLPVTGGPLAAVAAKHGVRHYALRQKIDQLPPQQISLLSAIVDTMLKEDGGTTDG